MTVQTDFSKLDPLIELAIAEDIGNGDHTTDACIQPETIGKAILLVKEPGIIAGVELAEHIFKKYNSGIQFETFINDGSPVETGDYAFEVNGPAKSILKAERVVLNFMQRMSGIATQTHSMVKAVAGFNTKILDTRKTTPGLRYFEKWAVRLGGGTNHRFGLYDMIMIKDNHIDSCHGIAEAVSRVVQYLNIKNLNLKIEVEARNLDEVQQILNTGMVDIIMLDNFSFENTRKAVALIAGRCKTESSGNIDMNTVKKYAECGVDFISSGSLTHSVKSLDLSLKMNLQI
jgi:nicotinate-nucleotide pyrophosphorylase (carboxylating)